MKERKEERRKGATEGRQPDAKKKRKKREKSLSGDAGSGGLKARGHRGNAEPGQTNEGTAEVAALAHSTAINRAV
jgi:hypothetical protein